MLLWCEWPAKPAPGWKSDSRVPASESVSGRSRDGARATARLVAPDLRCSCAAIPGPGSWRGGGVTVLSSPPEDASESAAAVGVGGGGWLGIGVWVADCATRVALAAEKPEGGWVEPALSTGSEFRLSASDALGLTAWRACCNSYID